jgi:flagella basal body P-ring formation protein FlgA
MPSPLQILISLILLDFMKMTGEPRTLFFPHWTRTGEKTGNCTSPYFFSCGLFSSWFLSPCFFSRSFLPRSFLPRRFLTLGILWLLGLGALPAYGDQAQINQAITQHLETLAIPIIKAEGWNGLRISHSSTPLGSSARQLEPCNQPPQVTGGSANELHRLRLKVRCPEPNGWQLEVKTEVQLWLPVLVTTRVIDRGDVISAADIKRQEVDINKSPRGFFHKSEQVIGLGAKRRIRDSQVLNPSVIALPLAIKRGDKVTIVASRDGINASMAGEAISNGAEGEIIRVRNLSSGKTIEAKVIAPGVVTSIF